MEYQDYNKITFEANQILYNGTPLDKNSIKAVFIEGMYSDTEFDENFNELVVKLTMKNGDSYILDKTINDNRAKSVIRSCAFILKDQKDIKKYATSLINMSCVRRVGIADNTTQKVKVVFKDGSKVRIIKTKLKPASHYFFKKINQDLKRYQSSQLLK